MGDFELLTKGELTMKSIWSWALIASAALSPAVTDGQTPLGTAFTYQGQLQKAGTPLTGTADFQFTLWDAVSGGTQIGATVSVNGVTVTDGLFTAVLDFGAAAFTGEARWLEIAVRSPAGSGTFRTLSPRQELRPAPYALALPGLWTQQDPTCPNLIGGYSGNSVTAGVYGATIGGGYGNLAGGAYATVPGGRQNRADGEGSLAAGYGAQALHGGCFVWKDNTAGTFASTANNQFLVRAAGGVGVNRNDPQYALDVQGDVRASGLFRGTATNADMLDGADGGKYLYDVSQTGRGMLAECAEYTDNTVITFSTPFAYYPVVVATAQATGVIATVSSWSSTGFTLRLTKHDGTAYTSTTYVHWIAIGRR
jgi:hypothetical protein